MTEPSPTLIQMAEKAAADQPNALVSLCAHTGHYQYVSPSYFNLLGYRPQDLLGTRLIYIVTPMDREHVTIAKDDALLHDKSVEITVTLSTKSGKTIPARASAICLTDPADGRQYLLTTATLVAED